jgi:4-oxalocrotonate tautomerase
MPLVRISIPAHFTPERQQALSAAVHESMVATINVPAADRFQIITRHAPAELVIDPTFLDIERGSDAVVVHITLRAGRTNDQKRALYAQITEIASRTAGMRPEDIMIGLSENTPPDWSFGKGIAQYAPTG